jgi:hypothetical protein
VSRIVKHFRAFVASPGDVTEERECLKSVIQELNDSWSEELGIHLDLIGWETHAYPGISTDPQAVINKQINDDYDIFIGIMWKRFGTPTERGGSGTEEEFDRAYKKYLDNPDSISILFYFNVASPDDISEIDPDQLKLVYNFKTKLEKTGTYYWTYRGLKEFEQFIRRHLTLQLQELKKNRSDETAIGTEAEMSELNETESLEEMGYLDLIELRDDNLVASRLAVERISVAVTDFGINLKNRGSEVENAKNPRAAKVVIDRAAKDMENFADIINRECAVFQSSFSQGVNASSKVIDLHISFNPMDKKDLTEQPSMITELKNNFDIMLTEEYKFKSVIESFPPMTTKINRAKKNLLSALEKFEIEMITATKLLSDLSVSIDNIINKSE